VTTGSLEEKPGEKVYDGRKKHPGSIRMARPRILVPVFPGTNGEYETAEMFRQAGGIVNTLVFRDLTMAEINSSLRELSSSIVGSQILVLPGGSSTGDEPEEAGKFIELIFRHPRLQEAIMEFLWEKGGLILGIGNGFQALVRLGLLPYGEIRPMGVDAPILTMNRIGRPVSRYVRTKIVSTLSPWFSNTRVGEIYCLPVSCREGRFVAKTREMEELLVRGQVAAQYVDWNDKPTGEFPHNPSGSQEAVESLTSPDGRILGRMGHEERIRAGVPINIPEVRRQGIAEGGVGYFL